jgi:invasion protein IalB
MRSHVCAFVALLGALSAPALSQTSKPAPANAREQPKPQAPAVTDGPIRMERTVFDSWVVTCQEVVGDAKSKRCSAVLSIVEEQSKRVAFLWAIGKNGAGALTAVFTTPTGINLSNGLDLQIGKGKPRKLPFTACDATSCEAVMALDESVLREARASDDASATITMKDGRMVRFSIINKGFAKALAAVRS